MLHHWEIDDIRSVSGGSRLALIGRMIRESKGAGGYGHNAIKLRWLRAAYRRLNSRLAVSR